MENNISPNGDERCLQLKDGVIQVAYKVMWKKLKKIIKRLGILVEL